MFFLVGVIKFLKMKTAYFLISIFSVLNMHQNNGNDPGQHRELFKQRIDAKYHNLVELITDQGAVSGVFYGVEILEDKTPLYYRAELEDIEIKEKQIKFSLEKYSFSHTAFYKEKKNVLLDPGDKSIPISLQHTIRYFGVREGNTLSLNRTLDYYDSRADKAIFVKITDGE